PALWPAGRPRPRARRTVGDPHRRRMSTGEPRRGALVTGANRGTGLAIARGLAGRGLHVVLGSRAEAAAEQEAAALTARGLAASGHQLDVTDPASVARAVADTANQHGRLDVLVNCAGIAIDRGQLAGSPDFERVAAT